MITVLELLFESIMLSFSLLILIVSIFFSVCLQDLYILIILCPKLYFTLCRVHSVFPCHESDEIGDS